MRNGKSENAPLWRKRPFAATVSALHKKEMRERIRQVMVFSGPRMLLYAPKAAIWHVICTLRKRGK
ncbi:MAG: nitrous oxide-stimulated promoter family protein [Blautia faecis]